jgi:hypothetical protein
MGGGLAEAVAADPAAMTHVNTARRQLAYGYPAYFLGAAGLITGLIIAGPVGLAVAGGGLIMGGTGAGLIFKSSTHFVDAVNIHNDNVATDCTTSP